jgi:hypothetical protein
VKDGFRGDYHFHRPVPGFDRNAVEDLEGVGRTDQQGGAAKGGQKAVIIAPSKAKAVSAPVKSQSRKDDDFGLRVWDANRTLHPRLDEAEAAGAQILAGGYGVCVHDAGGAVAAARKKDFAAARPEMVKQGPGVDFAAGRQVKHDAGGKADAIQGQQVLPNAGAVLLYQVQGQFLPVLAQGNSHKVFAGLLHDVVRSFTMP